MSNINHLVLKMIERIVTENIVPKRNDLNPPLSFQHIIGQSGVNWRLPFVTLHILVNSTEVNPNMDKIRNLP